MNKTKNHINPDKLLLSKWTALNPVNKEKHFIVVKVNRDDNDIVTSCHLEAVINHREMLIDWQCLQDNLLWLTGWK